MARAHPAPSPPPRLPIPALDLDFVLHGLPFPGRVGPFVRGDYTDYEPVAPGLGQSIAYHHAEVAPGEGSPATVTVYLYPGQPSPETADGREARLLREAESAVGSLQEAVDRGLYRAVRLGGHRWLEVGDALHFLLLGMTVVPAADGEPATHGAVCLTFASGRFLKLRVTTYSQEVTRMHAVGFSVSLARMLGLVGARGMPVDRA